MDSDLEQIEVAEKCRRLRIEEAVLSVGIPPDCHEMLQVSVCPVQSNVKLTMAWDGIYPFVQCRVKLGDSALLPLLIPVA